MNDEPKQRREDPNESEFIDQLRHCCDRAPLHGQTKAAALIGVLFALMERKEASPVATCAVFSGMWNETYGAASLQDPSHALDMLAAVLGQIRMMPQPPALNRIQGLLTAACLLQPRSGLDGSEFVEFFLRTWRRNMGTTPLGGLSEATLQPSREYARQLEQLVAGWEHIGMTGIVGVLVNGLCLTAKRAPVKRASVHELIDEQWPREQRMEPLQ